MDKEYLIQRHNDCLKIKVPEDWKVTFGPVAVTQQKNHGRGSLCLRFYESDTKQRAIFTDVVSFRDCSIPVEKLVKTKVGEDQYEYDDRGNRKLIRKAQVKEDWVEEEI